MTGVEPQGDGFLLFFLSFAFFLFCCDDIR